MEKTILLISIVAFLSCKNEPKEKEKFISDNPKATIFLLTETVKNSEYKDGYVEYWVKIYPKDEVEIKGVKYSNTYQMIKLLVDCKNDRFKFIAINNFSKTGESLSTKEYDENIKFNNAIPESSSYTMVKAGCE